MSRVLTYELRKFLYAKKNIAVLILYLVFLSGFIFYNYQQDVSYGDRMQSTMQKHAEKAMENAKTASAATVYIKDEKEIERLKKESDFWSGFSDVCYILQADYADHTQNSIPFLEHESKWYAMMLEGNSNGYDISTITQDTDLTLKENYEINQYLVKNRIPPQNSPYECSFFNLIQMIFSGYYPLILTALFLFLVFDIFASEFENGAYKTLYSTPYNRGSIYRTKFLFALLLVIAFVILMLLVFGIAGLHFGFGSPFYPYLINGEIDKRITAVTFMILIFAVGLLASITLLQAISHMTCSSSTSLACSIVLYTMTVIYQQIFDFRFLYPYLPTCTIYIKDIIQFHGQWISAFINSTGSIIVMLLAGRWFSRKDITVDYE